MAPVAVLNTMAILRIQAMALLLPAISYAIESPSPSSSDIISAGFSASSRQTHGNCNVAFQFQHQQPSSASCRRRNSKARSISRSMSSAPDDSCYMPPYGTVPRSSLIVLNMAGRGGGDGQFRKKMASKRTKDPLIQDFGDLRDWQASKTGVGRMGDDKMGDDRVSERFGFQPGGEMMRGERGPMMDDMMMEGPPPPMMLRNNDEVPFDNGGGGNYWVNPTGSMDRYPSGGGGRSRGSRRGRRRGGMRRDEDDNEFWETVRDEEGYYDDEFDDFDDEPYDEYGVPPPSRSRSSFRSGAPPPPRPVKALYDKLFWFGFDPDVTQPTDRTMFGGTRGKFNAMDLLNDREERQRMRSMGGNDGRRRLGGGGRSRGLSGRDGRDPVTQGDFGSVNDWNARRAGGGRTGGNNDGRGMGGPAPFPGDMPPPPPPMGMPEYDFDPGYDDEIYPDDMDFERTRRRDRGGRRRRRDNRRRDTDSRALEYDRFLAGGGGGDEYMNIDDEYMPPMGGARSSRRRKGYAYKFNLFDDDGEYIDVEPKYANGSRDRGMYASEGDMAMAQGMSPNRGRRRSWEERAIEMDRVPPRGAISWGPNGRIGSGEDPLDRAAMEALRDIKKSKRTLDRKENAVEEAREEVVNLKADASFCETQLEDSRGEREASKLEQELGFILRDVEDASRNLRLARAERDAASNRVSNLEERNWALLSEYEAARSFEEGMD